MPAVSATWYCRLPCRSRSQRKALPSPLKIDMPRNVSVPRRHGKRKLIGFNDLDLEKGSARAYRCFLWAYDLAHLGDSSAEYLSYNHPGSPARKFSLPAL